MSALCFCELSLIVRVWDIKYKVLNKLLVEMRTS